jgi:superfamily II DNA/RNA helicase
MRRGGGHAAPVAISGACRLGAATIAATVFSALRRIGNDHLNEPRTVESDFQRYRLEQQRSERANGNAYRDRTRLYPSVERLERAMSEAAFLPAERMPPRLLPRPVAELQLEGAALEALEGDAGDDAAAAVPLTLSPSLSNSEALAMSEQVTQELRAAREQVLAEDLGSNEVSSSATWTSIGLDPTLAELARSRFGERPTRVQVRLIKALVNEDHNDVIFSSVTGSGKTAALVLAALHGVRTEGSGMNLIVCRTRDMAYATERLARSVVGSFGGNFVDGDAGDMSWLLCLEGHRNHERHLQLLKQIRRESSHGPRLVVTTADVICELMFQTKMEFKQFGYLRRAYFDDAGQQFQVIRPGEVSSAEAAELQDAPTAADLLAATLHQLPGPDIRSLIQIAAVSADIDTCMKDHIKDLCVKPASNSIIVSAARLPATLHCLFSFHAIRSHGKGSPATASLGGSASSSNDLDAYLVNLIRNANSTIPGRAVIFVASEVNLLVARVALRRLGMDAKILCEVFSGGQWEPAGWKFLLLHEHEAFGHDIPMLSHVFITFPPSDRHSYLHMAGRAGRLGAPGWVYVVTDQRDAPAVAAVAGELDVDVKGHVITDDLRSVPASEVATWIEPHGLGIMNPQHMVEANYARLERISADTRGREFFDRPFEKNFSREDYRDPAMVYRKYKRAMEIKSSIQRDPKVLLELANDGLIDERLRPTSELHRLLEMEGPLPKRRKRWSPSGGSR